MARIPASKRAYIRRRTRPHTRSVSDGGELNIVPFLDIVVNLMLFLFATISAVAAVAQVEAQLPSHGPPCRTCEQTLDLSVTVTETGFFVAGSGAVLGEGCQGPGEGVTVPADEGALDFDGLGRCLAAIRAQHPNENEIIVGADPLVPYESLISTMDAVREYDNQTLFTEVRLSAGIR